MSERRYSESEIREVFERAARDQEQASRREPEEGLTLAEMQDVAASAGIAPEFVEAAARSVALGEPEEGRLAIGPVPRGVFRTEFLPGPPTDALWASLVADARRTFAAQGKVTDGGRVREWRNGNLRMTLEPAGDGSRLHLRTRRDGTPQALGLAAAVVLVGAFAAIASTTNAGFDPGGLTAWLMMIVGGLLGGLGIWNGQRTWAATRERQMAEVAQRAIDQSAGDPGRTQTADAPRAGSRLDLDALPDAPQADHAARRARTPNR